MKMGTGKRTPVIALLLVLSGLVIGSPARGDGKTPANSVGEASEQMRQNAENRSDALRQANQARGEAMHEQSQRLREETRQRVEQQNQEARQRHQNIMNRNRTPIGERNR